MSTEDAFTFDGGGESLHVALCRALGIPLGHGSKGHVAERLKIRSQRYSRVIARGVCALDATAQLCAAAGVRMLLRDRVVYFFPPGVPFPADFMK